MAKVRQKPITGEYQQPDTLAVRVVSKVYGSFSVYGVEAYEPAVGGSSKPHFYRIRGHAEARRYVETLVSRGGYVRLS